MALAVVIPALDEADRIAGAVASARAPEIGSGSKIEIVVVDGGSADATRERAAEAGARVVDGPKGRARQLDAGVLATRGDVVLFLHADSRLPRGYCDAIEEALADPGTVGGAFRFRFEDGDRAALSLRVVEWGARLRVALFGMPYGDQAIFVRRGTLEAIGGVPQAPIMEDLDLVRAARRRGRMARLRLPVTTSARRYRTHGVFRTAFKHGLAATAWALGVDRERVAAWYRR